MDNHDIQIPHWLEHRWRPPPGVHDSEPPRWRPLWRAQCHPSTLSICTWSRSCRARLLSNPALEAADGAGQNGTRMDSRILLSGSREKSCSLEPNKAERTGKEPLPMDRTMKFPTSGRPPLSALIRTSWSGYSQWISTIPRSPPISI